MELANKFNKAEADKRAGGHKWREYNFVGAVRMHHLPRHASRQAKQPICPRETKGRFCRLAATMPPDCKKERGKEEEEDDDERRGKSGALKGRKLFSSFLSLLGEDAK